MKKLLSILLAAILLFSLFLSLLSVILLASVDGVPLSDASYEVFSATASNPIRKA